jgi:hypothetical protein
MAQRSWTGRRLILAVSLLAMVAFVFALFGVRPGFISIDKRLRLYGT